MNIDIFVGSPTPIRTSHGYYVQRGDFEDICHGNMAAVAALRALETMTTTRIKELRLLLDIPADRWPPDELLWISVEYKAMTKLVHRVRGRSSLERALCDTPLASERERVTLQRLGFVRSRFVAYADSDDSALPDALCDREGRAFLVVLNMQGWVEYNGDLHLAADLGFSRVTKQYLYCFDAINSAICALDGIVYEPLKRWEPPMSETTGERRYSGDDESADTAHDFPQKGTLSTPVQGGTKKSGESYAPIGKNTITDREAQQVTELSADFTPEVLLNLVATILSVPQRDAVSDEVWQRDWAAPAAEWLQRPDVAPKLQYDGPLHPWFTLQLVLLYDTVPGSPSWWMTKRANKNFATTLRHIIKRYDTDLKDLSKRNWSPPTVESALGPPGTAPAPTASVEVPLGMPPSDAARLEAEIAASHPEIILSRGEYPLHDDIVTVGIAVGIESYYDLFCYDDWAETLSGRPDVIASAMRYGLSVGPPAPVVA